MGLGVTGSRAERRLTRPEESPRLSPIRSLAYFLPVIDELIENPPPIEYLQYLRRKASSFVDKAISVQTVSTALVQKIRFPMSANICTAGSLSCGDLQGVFTQSRVVLDRGSPVYAARRGARSARVNVAKPNSRRTRLIAATDSFEGAVISIPIGRPLRLRSITIPGSTRMLR